MQFLWTPLWLKCLARWKMVLLSRRYIWRKVKSVLVSDVAVLIASILNLCSLTTCILTWQELIIFAMTTGICPSQIQICFYINHILVHCIPVFCLCQMKIFYQYLRSEVITAVLLKSQVFYDVTQRRLLNSHRSSETSVTIYQAIGVTSKKIWIFSRPTLVIKTQFNSRYLPKKLGRSEVLHENYKR
jgi:hypothetical protein